MFFYSLIIASASGLIDRMSFLNTLGVITTLSVAKAGFDYFWNQPEVPSKESSQGKSSNAADGSSKTLCSMEPLNLMIGSMWKDTARYVKSQSWKQQLVLRGDEFQRLKMTLKEISLGNDRPRFELVRMARMEKPSKQQNTPNNTTVEIIEMDFKIKYPGNSNKIKFSFGARSLNNLCVRVKNIQIETSFRLRTELSACGNVENSVIELICLDEKPVVKFKLLFRKHDNGDYTGVRVERIENGMAQFIKEQMFTKEIISLAEPRRRKSAGDWSGGDLVSLAMGPMLGKGWREIFSQVMDNLEVTVSDAAFAMANEFAKQISSGLMRDTRAPHDSLLSTHPMYPSELTSSGRWGDFFPSDPEKYYTFTVDEQLVPFTKDETDAMEAAVSAALGVDLKAAPAR